MGSRLVLALRTISRRPDLRHRTLQIVRGLRPHHFLMAPPVLMAIVFAAYAIVQVPGLDFGWWTAIGGVGNPVTGGTERTTGTVLEWLLPAAFLTLLVPALPLFAYREEQIFRDGAERWSTARRIRRAVEFGLAHALIGIPVGVALALSIGGWYFTWRYLRGGLLESTRAHLAYNAEVVALVAVAFIVAYGTA